MKVHLNITVDSNVAKIAKRMGIALSPMCERRLVTLCERGELTPEESQQIAQLRKAYERKGVNAPQYKDDPELIRQLVDEGIIKVRCLKCSV